jgi:hypothetical protein
MSDILSVIATVRVSELIDCMCAVASDFMIGARHATGGYKLMHLLCEGVIWFRVPELLQSAEEDILG